MLGPQMPCFRCEKVQNDPVKGKSDWARFVLKGDQVLLCPGCQHELADWKGMGDRCPDCGSPRLKVVMGSVVCGACGSDFEQQRFR